MAITDIETLQAAQDRAAAEMRAANLEPAWRKGARRRFDQAMSEWLALGRTLTEKGVIR